MANILIDENANLKICDFGLAWRFKGDDDYLNKCCGTPTTWAPEVIDCKEYRMMPDWWSVGIIIYQFMCHRTPFELPEMKNDKNLDDDAWRKE